MYGATFYLIPELADKDFEHRRSLSEQIKILSASSVMYFANT